MTKSSYQLDFTTQTRTPLPITPPAIQTPQNFTDQLQRYLPNAAAARKRLLSHMAELEAIQATNPATFSPTNDSETTNLKVDTLERESRKWSQIYSYSYSQSLTGCVQQLEQLQRYTKEIVGERGYVFCLLYLFSILGRCPTLHVCLHGVLPLERKFGLI